MALRVAWVDGDVGANQGVVKSAVTACGVFWLARCVVRISFQGVSVQRTVQRCGGRVWSVYGRRRLIYHLRLSVRRVSNGCSWSQTFAFLSHRVKRCILSERSFTSKLLGDTSRFIQAGLGRTFPTCPDRNDVAGPEGRGPNISAFPPSCPRNQLDELCLSPQKERILGEGACEGASDPASDELAPPVQ